MRTFRQWLIWPFPSARAYAYFVGGFLVGGLTVAFVLILGFVKFYC